MHGESSATVRQRAARAREFQRARQGVINAQLGPREVIDSASRRRGVALLRAAMSRLNLSARGYHRVLKVARTIADLQQEEDIAAPHVAEAVQYRRLGLSDASRNSAVRAKIAEISIVRKK